VLVTVTATDAAGHSTTTTVDCPVATPAKIVVGARSADLTFAQVNAAIGPVMVTRIFFSGALPATYTRQGIPAGVKLVISYKTPDTNVAAYAASIPAGEDVEICYHHEPEADYTAGSVFVAEFDRQAATIHAANPAIPVAYIAGMFQYRPGQHGYDGSYIPTKADRHYADSYLPTAALIVPAQSEPTLTRFRSLLAAAGKTWDGLTEYGRGVIRSGASFDQAVADARVQAIQADATWLPTTTCRLWSYWYTTDLASGDQWRFTDSASISAWRAVANR
jgi:hypothetical protein